MGEPLRNELLDMLPNGLLVRGKPMRADAEGLFADCGRRS